MADVSASVAQIREALDPHGALLAHTEPLVSLDARRRTVALTALDSLEAEIERLTKELADERKWGAGVSATIIENAAKVNNKLRRERDSAEDAVTVERTLAKAAEAEIERMRVALTKIADLDDKTYYDDPVAGFAALALAALEETQ